MPSNKVQAIDQNEHDGHQVDDKLGNGPIQKRSCTDPLCCLLFLAFIGGMIGIAGWSLTKGHPEIIGRGYDVDGKICGYDSGYEDYPYLYWPVPFQKYLTQTVCVKVCPSSPRPSSVLCKYNSVYTNGKCTGPNSDSAIKLAATQSSAGVSQTGKFYIYDTVGVVNRFCVPRLVEDYASSASSAVLNSDLLQQWISDIKSTWQVIAAAMGAAFVVGFIYMIIMRWCSGILTWLAIIAFIAGVGVLGWRFYLAAQDLEVSSASTSSSSDSSSNSTKTIQSYRIIAYVCWGIAGFTVLSVLCLFNRIRLAIAIMKAAADYVRDTLSIFLVPPFAVLFLATFLVYWGVTAIYLASAGDTSQIGGTPFGSFQYDNTMKKLLIYHLLGLLWCNAFILASTQFVISSSACIWYFSQGTAEGSGKSVRTSIYRLFRYHFGSIAFGSLILAIVQLIRIILAYIQYQAKKMAGKESKVVQFILGCLQCYLACFERFIKFLNKNAYIQIALSGKSFCPAAKDAFLLIMKNPVRLGVMSGIGTIFIFFGKIFIGAITALGAFFTITKWDRYSSQVYSPFIPTAVVFVFAYGIGSVFMTVYGLAGDTILACFILDEEIQKKKNGVALHCPESLKAFLDKHKKD